MASRPGNRDYGYINKEAVQKRAAIPQSSVTYYLTGYPLLSLYLKLSNQFKWSFICTNNAPSALTKYLDVVVKFPHLHHSSFLPLTSMFETDACTNALPWRPVLTVTGSHWVNTVVKTVD